MILNQGNILLEFSDDIGNSDKIIKELLKSNKNNNINYINPFQNKTPFQIFPNIPNNFNNVMKMNMFNNINNNNFINPNYNPYHYP